MTAKLVGLSIGVGFGFIISCAGVTDPSVIRDMLLLRDAHVFLLMGSAIAAAAFGVRVLRLLRLRSIVTHEPIDWTAAPIHSRHVVGSVIFGAGWSVACTCPGPVAAMIGQGRIAGLIVGAGLISGIALKHRLDARPTIPRAAPEPSHAPGL
jgi:uncharacterized membrane protein YedE/YeeE